MEKLVFTLKKFFSKTFVKGLEFPERFLARAKSGKKDYTIYELVSSNRRTLILTSGEHELDRFKDAVDEILTDGNSGYDISLRFNEGSGVPYGAVTGFFKFNDEVFFRVKNGGGYSVMTDRTFSAAAREAFPDETLSTKEISEIIVVPLIAV